MSALRRMPTPVLLHRNEKKRPIWVASLLSVFRLSPLTIRHSPLFDGNLTTRLAFFAFDLRQLDTEDTVFNLRTNGLFVHIVR